MPLDRKSPSFDLEVLVGQTDTRLNELTLYRHDDPTREVAGELNRSVGTIEAHQANIKEKLHIRSGKDQMRFVIQWIKSRFGQSLTAE